MENPYNTILAGRVVQGVGAAGTAPIVMALLGDVFQSQQRSEVLGIIEAANGVGKVVSPILGAAIGLISWIALFFTYAALSVPVAAGMYFWGIEKKSQSQQNLGQYTTSLKKLFHKKGIPLIMAMLAGMLVLFVLFGILAFFSDYIENKFDIKGFVKGLVIAIPILFMSTTSYFNGRYLKSKNKGFKISILIGLFLLPLSLITLNFVNTLVIYLVFFSILGIGTGLTLPAVNTLVTSSIDTGQRGIITSLYGSARFAGVAIGPPVFSYLEEISQTAMYFGGGIISIVVLILAFFFLSEKGMIPRE